MSKQMSTHHYTDLHVFSRESKPLQMFTLCLKYVSSCEWKKEEEKKMTNWTFNLIQPCFLHLSFRHRLLCLCLQSRQRLPPLPLPPPQAHRHPPPPLQSPQLLLQHSKWANNQGEIILINNINKNFNRQECSYHGHHGSESRKLVQHELSWTAYLWPWMMVKVIGLAMVI